MFVWDEKCVVVVSAAVAVAGVVVVVAVAAHVAALAAEELARQVAAQQAVVVMKRKGEMRHEGLKHDTNSQDARSQQRPRKPVSISNNVRAGPRRLGRKNRTMTVSCLTEQQSAGDEDRERHSKVAEEMGSQKQKITSGGRSLGMISATQAKRQWFCGPTRSSFFLHFLLILQWLP